MLKTDHVGLLSTLFQQHPPTRWEYTGARKEVNQGQKGEAAITQLRAECLYI